MFDKIREWFKSKPRYRLHIVTSVDVPYATLSRYAEEIATNLELPVVYEPSHMTEKEQLSFGIKHVGGSAVVVTTHDVVIRKIVKHEIIGDVLVHNLYEENGVKVEYHPLAKIKNSNYNWFEKPWKKGFFTASFDTMMESLDGK
jgi:hypothetical protein